MLNGAQVTVLNNLSLNGITLRLDRTEFSNAVTNDVGLNFSGGSQTLGGTGIVELFNARSVSGEGPSFTRVRSTNAGDLTIGAGVAGLCFLVELVFVRTGKLCGRWTG